MKIMATIMKAAPARLLTTLPMITGVVVAGVESFEEEAEELVAAAEELVASATEVVALPPPTRKPLDPLEVE